VILPPFASAIQPYRPTLAAFAVAQVWTKGVGEKGPAMGPRSSTLGNPSASVENTHFAVVKLHRAAGADGALVRLVRGAAPVL